ncbi:MAG: aminotransferase class I/II-fold pyridoxal phosphate-dependent enzyme, partial [Olleya sp.]
ALKASKMWYVSLNNVYQRRRELVWQLATKLDCTFSKEASGLFVWAKAPEGFTSEAFIDKLLYEKNVFITPGIIFGTQGEGYVRFSLCATEEEIEEAINRIN